MEKVIVSVPVDAGSNEEFLDAAAKAGWTEDPGTGHSILIRDDLGTEKALEVVNPVPHAPPIGWTPTPPIEELIRQTVAREFALRDEEVIDDIVDAEDFDVPDELPPLETIYEFIGMEPQAPKVAQPSDEERAEAAVAYENLLESHRRKYREKAIAAHNKIKEEARRLYGDPPDDPDDGVKGA